MIECTYRIDIVCYHSRMLSCTLTYLSQKIQGPSFSVSTLTLLLVLGPGSGLNINPDQWPLDTQKRDLWAQEAIDPIAFQNKPQRCRVMGENMIQTYNELSRANAI